MKLNEEIRRLRADGSSPEAKGRVIVAIQRKDEHKTMKLIGKLSIPAALIAAVAIGGMLTVPRTALASPTTVAKAIRDIKNYVINSFTVVEGKRILTSKTTVVDGKAIRQFFDSNGRPLVGGQTTQLDHVLLELVDGSIDVQGKPGEKTIKVKDSPIGNAGNKQIVISDNPVGQSSKKSVEVKVVKDKDGKLTKHYFVDGKEVKQLPDGMKEGVHVGVGPDGTLSKEVQGVKIDLKDGAKGPVTAGGMLVIEGGTDGNISKFASGDTSVDYLLKLLEDPSRWTITRGVIFAGQRLDKFALNGPFSPIELYVDPLTSLPKVLRFVGAADGMAPIVEDEYVYGAQPPQK